MITTTIVATECPTFFLRPVSQTGLCPSCCSPLPSEMKIVSLIRIILTCLIPLQLSALTTRFTVNFTRHSVSGSVGRRRTLLYLCLPFYPFQWVYSRSKGLPLQVPLFRNAILHEAQFGRPLSSPCRFVSLFNQLYCPGGCLIPRESQTLRSLFFLRSLLYFNQPVLVYLGSLSIFLFLPLHCLAAVRSWHALYNPASSHRSNVYYASCYTLLAKDI